jgi:hypothetical protein
MERKKVERNNLSSVSSIFLSFVLLLFFRCNYVTTQKKNKKNKNGRTQKRSNTKRKMEDFS